MKLPDKIHYLLVSLIGFLSILVCYIFYIGIYTDFNPSRNTGGVKVANQHYSELNYQTSNFMDDFYMSLLLEEGIVTQRGVGAQNQPKFGSLEQYITQLHAEEVEVYYEKDSSANITIATVIHGFDKYPESLLNNRRFDIKLEKAKAYPQLRSYLEANNLSDSTPVIKIYDNNKQKTLYILSLEPLG